MKIGILTFHNELNYGAFLQTYALYSYLSKQNVNDKIEIIDYRLNQKTTLINDILTFRKKMNFTKDIKDYLKLSSNIEEKNFEKFISNYDSIIVGSDQVWAYDIIKEQEEKFFLNYNLPNVKKISYAASFGNKSNLEDNISKTLKYLKDFKAISIREKESVECLHRYGIQCVECCDPTLLLSREEYIKNFQLRNKNKRYLLVYMLVIDQKVVEVVNDIANKLDLDIICFNNRNRFGKRCKCMPNVSPKEFLELFYNASFVVTNSFHGTCFSIIFEKQFITFIHKNKGLRQINLLENAGLTQKIYNEKNEIDFYINDNGIMGEKLLTIINDSKRYLNLLGDSNE